MHRKSIQKLTLTLLLLGAGALDVWGQTTRVDAAGLVRPAGSSGNIQYNNTSGIGGSPNLHWDNSNAGLQIGQPSSGTGRIVVKGRAKVTQIHEVIGLKENTPDRTHECIGLFEQALTRYYARDWSGALALFNRSALLEPNQLGGDAGISSNPSVVYLRIIEQYRASPPTPDWDGVYVMSDK